MVVEKFCGAKSFCSVKVYARPNLMRPDYLIVYKSLRTQAIVCMTVLLDLMNSLAHQLC